ncbi:hypothetical protein F0562_022898 [Nyssa sinensis]|uniref:Uncharacterized protein n=1 Tax=Nyssa sinensis TaxID=561372 RepID=A0A5J5BGF8_9ASTE|nr:hypothetical protein F0562_022898 [Nyssa sinensis]
MDLRTIDRLLSSDKKVEFLSYIKRASLVTSGNSLKLRIGDSARFCPYDILEWICTYHAVKCGTALVEGNPDLKLDLNVYNKRGAYPLHMGAYSLCPGLTELFLRHGAQANVRCPAVKSEMYGLLPLHVALERVSAQISLTQWTTRHSIFKLIILLCLPEMKEALETSRLLAWNTCTKDFKEVICSYAKEGKLIELATLILVAQKNVMGPITVRSNDGLHLKEYMRFHQWVKSELAALIDQEYTLMGLKKEKKSIRMCKKKKVAMMSTLLLVEIFEKAGDPIEAYLQSKKKSKKNVPKERVALKISLLLAEAGFKLNCKDVDLSDRFDSWPTKLILERSGGPFRGDKEHSDTEKRKKCDSQQDDICNATSLITRQFT